MHAIWAQMHRDATAICACREAGDSLPFCSCMLTWTLRWTVTGLSGLASHPPDSMPHADLWSLQVKVQTSPGFANGLLDGLPKFVQQEGIGG